MKRHITPDGFRMDILSDEERKAAWAELDQDVSHIGTNIPCYTPRDNLEYYVTREVEVKPHWFVVVLSVKGLCFSIRTSLWNMQENIYKHVRKKYAEG